MQASTHPLDEQLAALLQRLNGTEPSPVLQSLVKYVSERTREGVIAAPLEALPEECRAALPHLAVVGKPGDYKPLICTDTHIWLYRYWLYEQRLTACIRARHTLTHSFAPTDSTIDFDHQQQAVEWARHKHFLIISGGPGTGKTTTVTRILAELVEQGMDPARILLAAPTGKAAMRMQESIRHTKQRLNLDPSLAERIPDQARTLHRLLGYIPNRVGFRHGVDNPLPADVVIVDEASMIDISLMTHLFEAVPAQARLILLGDKDQLASVETGSIFRDLCSGNALDANRVVLQKSYRFLAKDGIGQLAQAIREANEDRLLEVLEAADFPEVVLDEVQRGLNPAWLLEHGWQAYVEAVKANDMNAVFRAFNVVRILTPLRKGRQGVETLNAWVDNLMQRLLNLNGTVRKPWYVGRPVMVTQNDYRQNLFNGDIGITLPDHKGDLRVWFPAEESGQYRAVPPIRLPQHETAWAMTIHKSQGSEFSRVLLILPDAELALLGRELLYTAVTRAKQGIYIIAKRATLIRALQRVMPPSSQLQEKLSVEPDR